MNFAEMEARAFEILSESPASPAFWTSPNIRTALNDGFEVISEVSEWYECISPIPVLARRTYYDLRGLKNSPVLTPVALQFPQGPLNPMTRWLRPVTMRELDQDGLNDNMLAYPRWETVEGLTQFFFMRGLFWLGITPRSSSDTGIKRLSHTSIPPRLVSDEDTPGFPEEFHLGPVEYAVYDLFIRDGERGLAMEHWAEYQRHETGLTQYVKDRQARDRIYQMGPEENIE